MALCACAPRVELSAGDGPGRQSAFFQEFPTPLFEAIASGCQGELDRLTLVSERELLCETLPTPEAAASLILQFSGDVEDLPTLVTTLEATERGEGFAVVTEYFYRVPQRGGEVAEVRFAEPRVQRIIQRAFTAAGGTPIL
ncbi:MAG: hypothetical protein AAFQ54_12935 [Pseudomonadota bacterium]